ncbi:MAG: hypothetical protein GF331_11795 [Chitinivibrionales bacterium]|nr:hypothetical protein [Chitinivibrionales bacterium]
MYHLRCAATLLAVLYAVSSALADDTLLLDDNHNLGRVLGTPTIDDGLIWGLKDDDRAFLLYQYYTVGRSDAYTIHVSPLNVMGGNPSTTFYLDLVPEIGVDWRIGRANRFGAALLPLNLWFLATDYGGGSGLDMPYISLHRYRWSFLSRGGAVRVPETQLGYALHHVPLLSPGQVRMNVNLDHTSNVDSVPYMVFDVELDGRVGATEGLNLQLQATFARRDSVTKTWHSFGGDGDSEQYYDIGWTDTISTGAGLRYGRKGVFLSAEYGWSRCIRGEAFHDFFGPVSDFSNVTYSRERRQHEIAVYAGYLAGVSSVTAALVRANWDDSYDDVLRPQQWLNELSCRYVPASSVHWKGYIRGGYTYPGMLGYMDSTISYTNPSLRLTQRSRYGVFRNAEIAEAVHVELSDTTKPAFHGSLGFSFDTRSVRAQGASDASPMTYRFGETLAKGDVRGGVRFATPLAPVHRPYDGRVMLDYLNETYWALFSVADRFSPTLHPSALVTQRRDQAIAGARDWHVDIAYGLSNRVQVANVFRMTNMRMEHSPVDYEAWLFRETLGFTFGGKDERARFSLTAGFAYLNVLHELGDRHTVADELAVAVGLHLQVDRSPRRWPVYEP